MTARVVFSNCVVELTNYLFGCLDFHRKRNFHYLLVVYLFRETAVETDDSVDDVKAAVAVDVVVDLKKK